MKRYFFICIMLICQAFPGRVSGAEQTGWDTVPPVITLVGPNPINLELGYPYTEFGATAIDNFEGNVSYKIVISGTVNCSLAGTYTRTYTVSDSSGNTAAKNRSIYITGSIYPDTIPPVIVLKGSNPMWIYRGTPFYEPGATAWDNVDGDLTSYLMAIITVNVAVPGTYGCGYSVSDAAGNPSVKHRTVYVIDTIANDTISPVITLIGANPMWIQLGTPYIEPGATAVDNVNGDLTSAINIFSTVNTAVEGLDTVYYSVSDSAGNQATKIRLVHVIDTVQSDTIPPVMTLKGSNPMYLLLNHPYVEPGATAADNVDGDLTSAIQMYDSVNTSVEGIYSVLYVVSDLSGNTAHTNRSVHVIDSTGTQDTVIYQDTASNVTIMLVVYDSSFNKVSINPVDTLDPPDSLEILKAYDIDVSLGNRSAAPVFTIIIPYTDSEINEFIESTIMLYRYNENTHTWEGISALLDMESNTLTATVTHLSLCGILGRKDNSGIVTGSITHQTAITSINDRRILFTLARGNAATISLYSSSGRLIKTLFNGYAKAGKNSVSFRNRMVISNGRYFIVLKSGEVKMVLPYAVVD